MAQPEDRFIPKAGFEAATIPVGYGYTSYPAYHQLASNNPWLTGAWRRLPGLAVSALVGTLVAVAATIFVLLYSDQKPVAAWAIQPTVYLAIASAAANILLYFAFTKGIELYWWKISMKRGTTVGDQHRAWAFGNSLWASLTSGKYFNIMAAACLLVALTPINGPLLQQASTFGLGTFQSTKSFALYLAPFVPVGYTGYLSGREEACSLLTNNFSQVARRFSAGEPINITSTDCEGTCAATVIGAGFKVDCVTGYVPYNMSGQFLPNGYINAPKSAEGKQAFLTSFDWVSVIPSSILLRTQFKNSTGITGHMATRQCNISHAKVEYPVLVQNRTTISLAPGSSIFNDTVLELANDTYTWNGPTTIGGLAKVLDDTFSSSATIRFVGAVGFEILTTGSTALRYAEMGSLKNEELPWANYTLTFRDPTDELLASARDLMFRTAVHAANWSNVQQVTAEDFARVPVFQSSMLFLWLAVGLTLLGIAIVIPLFVGYSHLGRQVTLSPIETARAFSAPHLTGSDSNAEVEDLVKQIGQRDVQYGVRSEPTEGPSEQQVGYLHGGLRLRLAMGPSATANRPQTEQTYND